MQFAELIEAKINWASDYPSTSSGYVWFRRQAQCCPLIKPVFVGTIAVADNDNFSSPQVLYHANIPQVCAKASVAIVEYGCSWGHATDEFDFFSAKVSNTVAVTHELRFGCCCSELLSHGSDFWLLLFSLFFPNKRFSRSLILASLSRISCSSPAILVFERACCASK